MTTTTPVAFGPEPGTWKRRDLLKLPFIPWTEERGWWSSLLIVPGRTMHNSGWMHIAVIGVTDTPQAILGMPDVIELGSATVLLDGYQLGPSIDCTYPAGVLRVFLAGYDITFRGISSANLIVRRAVT